MQIDSLSERLTCTTDSQEHHLRAIARVYVSSFTVVVYDLKQVQSPCEHFSKIGPSYRKGTFHPSD